MILQAHLVHAKIPRVDEDDLFSPQRAIPLKERPGRLFLKVQRHVQHGLFSLIDNYYKPALERAVDNRGLTVTIFVAVLIATMGLLTSGIARVVVFPEMGSDFIQVQFEMERGSSSG